jgi:catechol 2,3-dioxygenase-like lactoylglutathione lyase family enzyme
MTPIPTRLLLYVQDIDASVEFYCRHFGFSAAAATSDGISELHHPAGGLILMLHRAARSQKPGQSAVKLVFDVRDVAAFREQARANGLAFGPLHRADGYDFANARDPSMNPVSVSSRAFRLAGQGALPPDTVASGTPPKD